MSDTLGLGIGWSPGARPAVGFVTSRTHGEEISEIGAEAAPPAKLPVFWPATMAIAFIFIGADPHMHIYWLAALIPAALLAVRIHFNTETWPRLYDTWDASYLCYRCGKVMIP